MHRRTGTVLPTVLLAAIGLGSSIPNGYARPGSEFGPAVDAACTVSNGTTPFAERTCALCHDTTNFPRRMDPEWRWWETGNLTAFCPEPVNRPPSGSIDAPAANRTITVGDAVNFNGTGKDPDGNLPLRFSWDFGGGAPDSSVEDPGSVSFRSAGTFTVTFTVTDSLGLRDPVADSRTITVNNPGPTCTDVDNDGFAREGGICGAVDCDDTNSMVNPNAPEICTDGLDNNCNGLLDAADTAVCPRPQGCIDGDDDMFSPEGGICGPLDCDDMDARINPSANETCGDGIDNDCDGAVDGDDSECSGGDCLSQLFNGDRDIDTEVEARWNRKRSALKVKGEGFTAGTVVRIYDADTGTLLGTVRVRKRHYGRWRFRLVNPQRVPCQLRVAANDRNQVFALRVRGAPDNCGDADEDGEDEGKNAEDEEDKGKEIDDDED